LVPPLQRGEELLVLLRLAPLRADEQEVENPDEQGDLNDKTR